MTFKYCRVNTGAMHSRSFVAGEAGKLRGKKKAYRDLIGLTPARAAANHLTGGYYALLFNVVKHV